MFSKSPFLWHIPSTALPHRDICVACSVTRARVAGKNGVDIVTHVLTWEWNLEKAHRVKKNRYSRTWIEHFLFFLALMSLNGTPEAGVFKARPRWRASSRPREHSALQVAWERSTHMYLVPLDTAALPLGSFQGHRCWQCLQGQGVTLRWDFSPRRYVMRH